MALKSYCNFGDSKIRHSNAFLLCYLYNLTSSHVRASSDFHQWQSSGLQSRPSLSWPIRHQQAETSDPWSARCMSYSVGEVWENWYSSTVKMKQSKAQRPARYERKTREVRGHEKGRKPLTLRTNLSFLPRVRRLQHNWSNKDAYRDNVSSPKTALRMTLKTTKELWLHWARMFVTLSFTL